MNCETTASLKSPYQPLKVKRERKNNAIYNGSVHSAETQHLYHTLNLRLRLFSQNLCVSYIFVHELTADTSKTRVSVL